MANLGDVFYLVAFLSSIYAATASVVETALVPVVILSAQSLGAVTAPFVFQRLTLPQMLVFSQGAKTLLLAVAATVVSAVSEADRGSVLALYCLGAAIAFMDGWANPARNALVPR